MPVRLEDLETSTSAEPGTIHEALSFVASLPSDEPPGILTDSRSEVQAILGLYPIASMVDNVSRKVRHLSGTQARRSAMCTLPG